MSVNDPEHEIRGALFAALRFFTCLPLPNSGNWKPQHDRDAAAYAPMVGWLIGLLTAAVFLLTAALLPIMLAVALTLAATTLITGALHEDGFADFCDGFGAIDDPERLLAIMRDASIGAYGVLGTVLLFVIKFTALVAVAETGATLAVVAVLIVGHGLNRFVSISFMYTHRYVREDPDAKGRRLSTAMDLNALGFAAACGIVPLVVFDLLALPSFWSVLLPLLILWLILAWTFMRRLQGYTGDCLGAAQQLAEAVIYIWAAHLYGL